MKGRVRTEGIGPARGSHKEKVKPESLRQSVFNATIILFLLLNWVYRCEHCSALLVP